MSECPQCGSADRTEVSSNNSDTHRVARYLCADCFHAYQVVDA